MTFLWRDDSIDSDHALSVFTLSVKRRPEEYRLSEPLVLDQCTVWGCTGSTLSLWPQGLMVVTSRKSPNPLHGRHRRQPMNSHGCVDVKAFGFKRPYWLVNPYINTVFCERIHTHSLIVKVRARESRGVEEKCGAVHTHCTPREQSAG